MAEDLPPLPPGAPILLALLSLAGGGTLASRGPMWIQMLDMMNRSELQPLHRGRRAILRPPPPRKAQAGRGNPVTATPGRGALATGLPVGKTERPEPFELGEDGRLTHPASLDPRPSLPTRPTEAGAARTAGCQCPGGEPQDAKGLRLGKDAKELGRAGSRLPTPRTEEAAWAASALAFLLAVLTLAVLYTRLHRKCRRGRSLYWTTSGEDEHETVAAVLKRRLPASQARRKKRVRPPQQRPLLSATSSETSE